MTEADPVVIRSNLEEAWALLAMTPVTPGELVTRGIGVGTAAGEVEVATDTQNGWHLLLPVNDPASIRSDSRSKGVQIVAMTVETDGRAFADVRCPEPTLREVFLRLASDVVEGIVGGADPVGEAHRVLARWRDLLERRTGSRLGQSEERGLVGELLFLRELVERDPARRLGWWTGPSAKPHDFRAGEVAVEVKTTGSVDGRRVEIHGLEQLDAPPGVRLHVRWYRILDDPSGESVTDLVSSLEELGVGQADLESLLQLVGWARPDTPEDERRYILREDALYVVGSEFPRIVRGTLPPKSAAAIESVSYAVDLVAVQPSSEEDYEQLISDMVNGADA